MSKLGEIILFKGEIFIFYIMSIGSWSSTLYPPKSLTN